MKGKEWEVAQGNSSKMANLEDAGMSAGCVAGLPTDCAVSDTMSCNNSWRLGGEICCLPLSYLPFILVSSQGLVWVAP